MGHDQRVAQDQQLEGDRALTELRPLIP